MPSHVYLLVNQPKTLFKIGKANDILKRATKVGLDHVLFDASFAIETPTETDAHSVEKSLHHMFRKWRVPYQEAVNTGARETGSTEWFQIDCLERLKDHVAANADLLGRLHPIDKGHLFDSRTHSREMQEVWIPFAVNNANSLLQRVKAQCFELLLVGFTSPETDYTSAGNFVALMGASHDYVHEIYTDFREGLMGNRYRKRRMGGPSWQYAAAPVDGGFKDRYGTAGAVKQFELIFEIRKRRKPAMFEALSPGIQGWDLPLERTDASVLAISKMGWGRTFPKVRLDVLTPFGGKRAWDFGRELADAGAEDGHGIEGK